MEIFFTDSSALAMSVPDVVSTQDAQRRAAQFRRRFLPEGLPFIINSDGSYNEVLNRFLRSLPTSGVRSPASWRAYGLDLLTWARFLEEHRGRTMLDATREDLEAFHAARRLSDPPYRVSAATWNRLVAALEKFYGWTLAVGLLGVSPFGFERLRASGELAVVGAKETAARRGDVRFLSLPRYAAFRDVGLRGLLPMGAEDPDLVGRCGPRNTAFADLCVSTGLRLEEASSLLACELPAIDGAYGARSARFELPPLITKGDRGREIWIPHRVLRQLQDYLQTERSVAVQRASRRGGPRSMRWLLVHRPSAGSGDGAAA